MNRPSTVSDGVTFREARDTDRDDLLSICLRTGDAGNDATAREDDPDLFGLIYAIPYPRFAPGLSIVAETGSGMKGYVVGALDSDAFNRQLARHWFPALQQRVPLPPGDRALWRGSDWARHHIHNPPGPLPPQLRDYPSHAHIDILPELQRRGVGRTLLTMLEQRLAAAGSSGLHLAMDRRNLRALAFYQVLGYAVLPDVPGGALYVGKRFTPAT